MTTTHSLALSQLVSGFSIATAQFQAGQPANDILAGVRAFLPSPNGPDDALTAAVEPLQSFTVVNGGSVEVDPRLLASAFHESAAKLQRLLQNDDPPIALWAENVRQVWRRGISYPPQVDPKALVNDLLGNESVLIDWLRQFVEFSPQPMGVVKCHSDGAAEMVLFNRKNRERWGLDEKGLAGVDVLRFFYPEDHDMVRGFIRECLESGNATRTGVRMLRRAGGHLLVDMYVGRVDATNYAYFQVIDETQREEAVQQVGLRDAVFRNAGKPFLMLGFNEDGAPAGMVTSAGFDRMLGYAPGEIGTKPVIDFIPHHLRDEFTQRIRQFLTSGVLAWPAVELLCKDGSTKLVDIEAYASGVKHKRFAIVSFGDAAARIASERDALEAQKFDIIAAAMAGVWHDGNNIMTIIRGGLELLARKHPDDDFLPTMLRKADMLTAMLQGLRRLTDTVEREGGIDLHSILSEADIRLATPKSKEVDIHFDLDDDTWTVAGPNFAVWQILFNVIKNAVESMEHAPVKRLTVRTENINIIDQSALPRLDPDGHFPEAKPGDFVKVTIEDTGSGIAPNILPRIFEDYFSTKDSADANRGRGLSTTLRAVARRGGIIAVHSEVGRGTTFDVYLPRTEPRTPTPPPVAVSGVILPNEAWVSPGDEVVLIADDDEGIRNQYERILGFLKYQNTIFVSTSDDVLRIARERPGLKAIVMDWRMPGITGDELLRELHALNPNLPILVNTGLVPGQNMVYPNVQFTQKLTGLTRVGPALRALIEGRQIP